MRSFWNILQNALTRTADLVHVTPNHVEISHPPLHGDERRQRRITAAVALTARGSVALSRLPVVTEEEIKARKARALAYDFSANY